jgi:antirestriction protein ArdC
MLDIAQTITDKIISELEKGSTPWVKPWKRLRSTPGHGMPYNPVSGTIYSGHEPYMVKHDARGLP